jgi:hypothetical protein
LIRSIAAGALLALATLTGAPASANPTDDVRAAMLKFADLNSWEMSFGSGARQATMDYVKPNSMRMSSRGMQMVHVGNTTYVNMNGKWQKFTHERAGGGFEMADHIRRAVSASNGVTATDLGMKSIGGETLHAYKMTPKDGQPGTIYIGADGLPHRFQGSDTNNEVVTISKFNQVAPIRAPI